MWDCLNLILPDGQRRNLPAGYNAFLHLLTLPFPMEATVFSSFCSYCFPLYRKLTEKRPITAPNTLLFRFQFDKLNVENYIVSLDSKATKAKRKWKQKQKQKRKQGIAADYWTVSQFAHWEAAFFCLKPGRAVWSDRRRLLQNATKYDRQHGRAFF